MRRQASHLVGSVSLYSKLVPSYSSSKMSTSSRPPNSRADFFYWSSSAASLIHLLLPMLIWDSSRQPPADSEQASYRLALWPMLHFHLALNLVSSLFLLSLRVLITMLSLPVTQSSAPFQFFAQAGLSRAESSISPNKTWHCFACAFS